MPTPLSMTTPRNLMHYQTICKRGGVSGALIVRGSTKFYPLSSRVAYYGVFDGHAGNRASTYTAEHLHQNIQCYLPRGDRLLMAAYFVFSLSYLLHILIFFPPPHPLSPTLHPSLSSSFPPSLPPSPPLSSASLPPLSLPPSLPPSLKGNVHNLDREVKKCLLESFKKTDEDFLRKAADASPSWKDG